MANMVYNRETLDRYILTQVGVREVPFSTQMSMIRPLAQTLDHFVATFERTVSPHDVDMSLLWSMVYYTIQVASLFHPNVRHLGSLSLAIYSCRPNHSKS
jgi:hypothetical protein